MCLALGSCHLSFKPKRELSELDYRGALQNLSFAEVTSIRDGKYTAVKI